MRLYKSTSSSSLSLLATEPSTTVLGGSEVFVGMGSTINLTCVIRLSPEPPNSIRWQHNNQVRMKKENLNVSLLVYFFFYMRDIYRERKEKFVDILGMTNFFLSKQKKFFEPSLMAFKCLAYKNSCVCGIKSAGATIHFFFLNICCASVLKLY